MAEVKEIKNENVNANENPEIGVKAKKPGNKKGLLKKIGKRLICGTVIVGSGIGLAEVVLKTVGKPTYATLPMSGQRPEIDATEGIDFIDAAKTNLENVEVKEF